MTQPSPYKSRHRLIRPGQTIYQSPWTLRESLGMMLWQVVWLVLFRPSPRQCKRWRAWLLRCFGCRVHGRPYVHNTAKIRIPWLLELEDRATLGEHSEVYNLGLVTLRRRCTVAQHVYLCAGTHDFSDPETPLLVAPIEIGRDAFIGARTLILPGVVIGARTLIGAGSVVTRDMPAEMVCAGNPCRPIKPAPGAAAVRAAHADDPPDAPGAPTPSVGSPVPHAPHAETQ